MTIKELCNISHKQAIIKGFWGKNGKKKRNDGELIALMHSELSEALEAIRTNNHKSEHIPKFSALDEEIADCCIRIFDYCEAKKINLEEAIIAKLEYNKSRPQKHGKKF